MKRAAVTAAAIFALSCARAGGPKNTGMPVSEGIDPSRDRYLTETFLDVPLSGPALEAGAGIKLDGSGESERRDAWVRIRTRGIRGAGRLRVTGDRYREAFHLAVAPAGRLRIDLGDLVPDLGIGLISSGRRFTWPFSSNHPLYRARGIRGWTGFYGSFIRGGSVHAVVGPVRLTLLSGRPASHGVDGVEYCGGRNISGFRFEAGSEGIMGGLTVIDAGSRRGESIVGLDLTHLSGRRRYMIETAASSSGNLSAVWGVTIDGRDIDCGMLGWSVTPGSDGFLASFPGLSAAGDRSRSGASITLRKKFPRRISLSAWGELRRNSDGEERELDRALRLEARIRWKRSAARCAWSSRVKESEILVPFPPHQDRDEYVSRGLVASCSCRPAAFLGLTIELKRPGSDGDEGLLGSARASLELKRLHSRILISAASYRSGRGKARFSLYEPSGGGIYPWKTLYGSGNRISFGFDAKAGGMKASLWLLWTSEDERAAAIRLTVGI